ncbi:MAG: ACT domain-containing protein [Negativicutes bacterium]|nr:ACT domain-containing protein [Negativicutes bacterium]
MSSQRSQFYLVREEVLPEALKKTIMVKDMLKRGEARTINEAVGRVELSRSAYYKYKDYVFPFYEASREKILTLMLSMSHRPGMLSRVLQVIATAHASILTINQSIPLAGVANVTIAVETANMVGDVQTLIARLEAIDGVNKLDILGQA